MALLPRLRQLMRRPSSASRVGARRPTTAARRGDTLRQDALRSMLSDDPNNERAFVSPDESERQRAAARAVWALGEELAGNPRAWYPLIEVARLSVSDDHEGTLRRLRTAAERDPSGRALAEALALLREAGAPVDALGLGVGHWHPKDHDPEVARQLVLASIEAGRPLEAKQHIRSLDLYRDQRAVAGLREELIREVAQAEQTIPGT